ncbi:transposase family protein [Nonomuraea sp. 3N208]|uniref:transposase family protein n=1 Tax=Nonomuraea sp. 3N208 TaxID=3457421 RepID=UPI003FD1E146
MPVVVAEYASLLDHLRQVPDPRDRRGIRHALASILAVAAAAVLAGARSFTAIGEWTAMTSWARSRACSLARRRPM